MPPLEAPRVFLVCAGLDHAWRGFETFARECFNALRDRPDLDITLVKGSGQRALVERTVPLLRRDRLGARLLGRATGLGPIVMEHLSFAVALMPVLARRSPDVVYFSEWHLGRVLGAWRRVSRQRFALAFCNGALAAHGFEHLDRVQQLVPGAIEYTAGHGESPDRQVLLPLGVAMSSGPVILGRAERIGLRSRLGLPPDRTVVMSAGAINRQKRMDFLIEEIASIPEPRPYLLLAGQQSAESASIRDLAMHRLGPDGHDVRTVTPEAMPDIYRASDAFVLGSLWESFGRVLVEAQSHGLPCLAHDYPVMRWVLGEEGDVTDLTQPGSIRRWLEDLDPGGGPETKRRARHRLAYTRFSWDALADSYVQFLRDAADAGPAPR